MKEYLILHQVLLVGGFFREKGVGYNATSQIKLIELLTNVHVVY